MRSSASLIAFLALVVLAGAARAEPVNYKELMPLIKVSLPGWTASEPTGQTIKSPVEASEASVTLTKDDMSLEVSIYDGGPAMAAAMSAVAQVEMESPEEVIKPVTVKGFKGSLYLHVKDKEADMVVMVPPRFAVTLHMQGASDEKLLQDAAAQVDMAKLSTLAK